MVGGFSPASSTTKTGRHDKLNIDESGVKHQKSKSINQINTMYLL
jgi:hypothetical protein